MPTLERRITSIDTVPALQSLAGVINSQNDHRVLIYTGSDDIGALFNQGYLAGGTQSPYYVYAAVDGGATPKIARVTGIYQIGTGTWNIQLDRAFTGALNVACKYVFANLIGYSIRNDGGTSGTVNGVSFIDGQSLTEPPLSPSGIRNKFQDVVLCNASGTSFFVLEDS